MNETQISQLPSDGSAHHIFPNNASSNYILGIPLYPMHPLITPSMIGSPSSRGSSRLLHQHGGPLLPPPPLAKFGGWSPAPYVSSNVSNNTVLPLLPVPPLPAPAIPIPIVQQQHGLLSIKGLLPPGRSPAGVTSPVIAVPFSGDSGAGLLPSPPGLPRTPALSLPPPAFTRPPVPIPPKPRVPALPRPSAPVEPVNPRRAIDAFLRRLSEDFVTGSSGAAMAAKAAADDNVHLTGQVSQACDMGPLSVYRWESCVFRYAFQLSLSYRG